MVHEQQRSPRPQQVDGERAPAGRHLGGRREGAGGGRRELVEELARAARGDAPSAVLGAVERGIDRSASKAGERCQARVAYRHSDGGGGRPADDGAKVHHEGRSVQQRPCSLSPQRDSNRTRVRGRHGRSRDHAHGTRREVIRILAVATGRQAGPTRR